MESIVVILVAAVVTLSTSSMITPTFDMVTVRLGEAIHLSCVITLTPIEFVSEVRWYRSSNVIPYGSIDVTSGCGDMGSLMCPEELTTDNRGIVRYEIGTSNGPLLTLTINSSTSEDNTSFRCGIIKGGGTSQTSSGISVTVYVPEATSPIPTESTTNSPDTTTVDGSTSSHQTSTTSTADATSTARQTTPDRSISSHQASTTETTTKKAISAIFTETSTDQNDDQQDISTIPRQSSSTTDKQGSFEASVSPTVTVLAVAVSACLVTIIILLIIIVSSRKRRSKDAELRLCLRFIPEDVASSITSQGNDPMYQNTNQPHTSENSQSNIPYQDGDKLTSERPSTVATLPTYYEPVHFGGGSSTQQAVAQRQPGRRVQVTPTVTTGDAESGYQALEMTNQPPAEYTKLDLTISDG